MEFAFGFEKKGQVIVKASLYDSVKQLISRYKFICLDMICLLLWILVSETIILCH